MTQGEWPEWANQPSNRAESCSLCRGHCCTRTACGLAELPADAEPNGLTALAEAVVAICVAAVVVFVVGALVAVVTA